MRALKDNSILTLYSNGRPTVFRIKSLLGMGGTSVVYAVEYKESEEVSHFGILKEYCPAGTTRKEEQLIVAEKDMEAFYKGMKHFKESYIKINRYLNENLVAQNFHPYQLAFYEGSTSYMLMTADCGKSYDQVEDDSLETLLKRMIAITTAVSHYHHVNMLYLDIKSKNILILDGGGVKLFDYDSIIEISQLKEGNVTISIPEDFYVPELEAGNLRKISKATDIYLLGALLFHRLFGRAPLTTEIQRRSHFDFSKAPLLQGVSEKIVKEIEVVLKHTLQVVPNFRYQDSSELLLQLEKIICMVRKEQSIAQVFKCLESIMPNTKDIYQYWKKMEDVAS